jgi:amino acid transporter
MTPEKILLFLYVMITASNLISRSVMEKVGDNDGSDCPDASGPIIACIFYGLNMFILIGLTVKGKMNNELSPLKLGVLILLIILCLAVFVSYIPFSIKANNKSSTDKECLTDENKNAIETMEIIISGALILLTPIMIFS